MTLTLTINPKVREIFEAAIKAAQPVWLGITFDGIEVIERCQVYFEPTDVPEYYVNVNELRWLADRAVVVNGANLSKTKTSAPFVFGPMTHQRELEKYDTLLVCVGGLQVSGPVTKELSS